MRLLGCANENIRFSRLKHQHNILCVVLKMLGETLVV